MGWSAGRVSVSPVRCRKPCVPAAAWKVSARFTFASHAVAASTVSAGAPSARLWNWPLGRMRL
eukprot:4665866-Prymnesium_polylepis.1